MMKGIYLILGSNLGDRFETLHSAQLLIQNNCGNILQSSSIYESAPWGIKDQPAFLNQVIEIESNLLPEDLLIKLQEIEIDLGRERYVKWGARIIDIDILYYGENITQTNHLTIPHPEIPNRKFTLVPLNEIASSLVHPVLETSQKDLLEQSEDKLWIRKYTLSEIPG